MADRRRYPVADSTSPVMWLVWLFAILAASACSTVQVEPKLDTRKDIPALNVQRLPIRAALVLPDLPQTVSSPPFSCPLMANSYVMTVQPSPLLTLAGVPLLAQAFDSLDVITDKAAAAGQYDLFIELGTPRIQFMEGDCGTVLHILGYLFPLTTPTALVATFLAIPGIDAEMEFRATVMEARGERLLADIAFKARKAVLEPGMGPGLPGTNLQAIVTDLFTKLTQAIVGSPRVLQYARAVQRKPEERKGQEAVAIPPAALKGPAEVNVDVLPATSTRVAQGRHAVVIGIERYRQRLPPADYAAHDAQVVAQYLTRVLGYAEENVALLLDDRASRTDLEKYLEAWLPNRVERGDTVFVYFSGHGAPDPKTGKAYLVPYDGDPAFVEQTGYPLDRLYERLSRLPAQVTVVVLDSCFSGAGGRSIIAKGMRPMILSLENPLLAGGKTVVLTASAGIQVSSTYEQQRHGLLTYFFLRGLRGEGDLDRNGRIDLQELYEYLKPHVERTARRDFNNEQTPQLLGDPNLLKPGIRLIDQTESLPRVP